MFFLRRPSAHDVERFLTESRDLSLSYEPIGLAIHGRVGFDVDEQIMKVGSGQAAFVRATRALAEWTHFDLGWVEVFPARAAIAPGS